MLDKVDTADPVPHSQSLAAALASFAAVEDPSQRMDRITKVWEAGTRDDSTKSFLCEVLRRDPDPVVRHEAAFVLGKLRETGQIDDAIAAEALCEAARADVSLVVRHEAAEALQAFDGPYVGATLESLLDDPFEDIRLTAKISSRRRANRS